MIIIIRECGGGCFSGGGGEEHAPELILLNTLNNAFWRHIYTELRTQAISQVIISRDYVYQYLKK